MLRFVLIEGRPVFDFERNFFGRGRYVCNDCLALLGEENKRSFVPLRNDGDGGVLSIKVKDLAKEMKIASGALKSYLKIVGVEVKNHLSVVSDEDAQKVKQFLKKHMSKVQDTHRKTKKIHQKDDKSPRTSSPTEHKKKTFGENRGKPFGQWSSSGELDRSKSPVGFSAKPDANQKRASGGGKVNVDDDAYRSKSKKARVFKDSKPVGSNASFNKAKKKKKDEEAAKNIKQILVGPG